MHELLLYAQVPPTRHTYVLNVLAGLAAMQPQTIHEKHLVFKPARLPASARSAQVGAIQGVQNPQLQALQGQISGDLFYLQLVSDMSKRTEGGSQEEESEAKEGNVVKREEEGMDVFMEQVDGEVQVDVKKEDTVPAAPSTDGAVGNIQNWIFQFRDLPEPAARRPVTSRLMADIPISSGDPLEFMSALNYSHTSTYFLLGHRLTHNSTSILFYQPFLSLNPPKLLDPGGTYMLQTSVRVQDGSKPDIMGKGIQELLALKDMLRGCVELEMGERLALDTRVR